MKIKKTFLRHWVLGGIGGFILGLGHQVLAEEPVSPAAETAVPDPATKSETAPETSAVIPPAANSGVQALAELSIDDLLNVTVTSAGQKEQKLSDVAAAITVLNANDIHRSGATNIPDLLRYVPGVEVSQANNMDASVTIRGFGSIFSSKLLVLVDGRSIYDPIFAGVDWGFQRMVMDDIDRVEVIRGPGATIWGANAVNGVINIITKDAKNTQDGFVSGLYGTQEQGTGTFRYGFQPTEDLSLRLYGQYENVAANRALPGVQKYDDLENGLFGFRADYRPTTDDHFRLSSEASSTRAGNAQFANGVLLPPRFDQTVDAENVNFVYEHNFDTDNQLTVQSYYDRFKLNTDPEKQFSDSQIQTADVQIRHTLPLHLLPIKQELIYGAEYRLVDSQLNDTKIITWDRNRSDQTASFFVQTDLHLIEDELTLTMGTKFDHNDYTGPEVQPSARVLWKADSKNSLWWSISRAVREPALINANPISPGVVAGNSKLDSEEVMAYEMGYRVEPLKELSIDISCFYNNYHNLMSVYLPPGAFVPVFEQFQNAQTYGVEPSFKAQLQPWWKLSGSYSLLHLHTDNSGIPGNLLNLGVPLERGDPQHQFSVRTSFDLPHNIDIDLGGRYVDNIRGANSYFAVDVRVGWQPTKNWEISVVAQNLLAGRHLENPSQFGNTTYVSPEIFGKVMFKF
jgi:iron complex outermembrane receptor protein